MSERVLPGEESSQRPRVVAIDYLKAISVVAIVWIHAFVPSLFPPGNKGLYVASGIALFAVPGFFFASGFLYQRDLPIPWPLARRRLMRILVPYLIASLFGEIFNVAAGAYRPTLAGVLYNLATGNSLGIYYFVPLLMLMVFLSLILSRAPLLFLPLLAISLLIGFLNWTESLFYGHNFFWNVRDPFRWSGYFLFGWFLHRHWRAVACMAPTVLLGARSLLAVMVLLYAAYLFGQERHAWNAGIAGASYLVNYAIILAIFLLTMNAPGTAFVRWLSERSYAIYLYHFFFLSPVLQWMSERTALAPLAAWAAGLTCAGLLGHWVRRVLGPERARTLLGV